MLKLGLNKNLMVGIGVFRHILAFFWFLSFFALRFKVAYSCID